MGRSILMGLTNRTKMYFSAVWRFGPVTERGFSIFTSNVGAFIVCHLALWDGNKAHANKS